MYHIVFIKTENKVVNEIGRIICSHLLAHALTYSYITLLCMHGTATYNIVPIKSTVRWKFKSHSTYQPAQLSRERVRLIIQRSPVRTRCESLFFFQQCSIYRWRPAIGMTEVRRIQYSKLVSDKILILSLFIGCFYHKGLALRKVKEI